MDRFRFDHQTGDVYEADEHGNGYWFCGKIGSDETEAEWQERRRNEEQYAAHCGADWE